MMSSTVPAGERMVAVRFKPTEPGGGERKDREQPRRSRHTRHSNGFWDHDQAERDHDVTNRGLPHQGYKPSKARPTWTESPAP